MKVFFIALVSGLIFFALQAVAHGVLVGISCIMIMGVSNKRTRVKNI
ncbi:hypothetical protein [Desulfosporosinus orientis]|nr:hypothetical protein [Desulfosporosinus orientis]